jgi:hypothetical protein
MHMLNKRKAMIGWLVYTLAKPMAKRAIKSKAKGAVPSGGGKKGGARIGTMLAVAGAAAGALMFWRSRSDGDEPPGASDEPPAES